MPADTANPPQTPGTKAIWVKICGITNLADALLALRHGADALGFIFAPSKRCVTPQQAAAITAHLTAQLPAASASAIERIGIFTQPDLSEIVSTVSRADLSAVQLHFAHDPLFTSQLAHRLRHATATPKRLIQVVGVPANLPAASSTQGGSGGCGPEEGGLHERQRTAGKLRSALADPTLWAVLLDTEKDGHSGGLGLPFPWPAMQPLLTQVLAGADAGRPRIVLAGGLNPDNVEKAILLLRPFGVDCVSGTEAAPGQKDPVRLAAFLRNVRSSQS